MGAIGLINSIVKFNRVNKARKELKSRPYCSNCDIYFEPGTSVCPSCKREITIKMDNTSSQRMNDIKKYNLIGILLIIIGFFMVIFANFLVGMFFIIVAGVIFYVTKQKYITKPMRELEEKINDNFSCPYCGKKVSADYNVCPHCTKDIKGKITPLTVRSLLDE